MPWEQVEAPVGIDRRAYVPVLEGEKVEGTLENVPVEAFAGDGEEAGAVEERRTQCRVPGHESSPCSCCPDSWIV